jgi:Spy/CpxP family protein refolding chaperone
VSHWKVILATLVIFIAGLVTGGLLVKKTQPHPPRVPPDPALSGPFFIQQRFLDRMGAELDLTPEQYDRLQTIFAESRERIRILWDLLSPEMEAELREVREKIKAELTPPQRREMERLLTQTRPRPPQEFQPGPGPWQPGPRPLRFDSEPRQPPPPGPMPPRGGQPLPPDDPRRQPPLPDQPPPDQPRQPAPPGRPL